MRSNINLLKNNVFIFLVVMVFLVLLVGYRIYDNANKTLKEEQLDYMSKLMYERCLSPALCEGFIKSYYNVPDLIVLRQKHYKHVIFMLKCVDKKEV